jgi:hypothetical protein
MQLSERNDYRGIFESHTARLPNVMIACVYGKDSLIVVERRFRRFRRFDCLVEYLICHGQGSVRRIERTEKVLTECRKPISKKSKMAVVRTGAQMLVIICNWDFTIDMIAFTPATASSSVSSTMSMRDAGDRLITLLREDPILQPLYQEALAKVAAERLERNLRRLLKRFAVDLQKEAENAQQRDAAHFVRSRARNSAHIICCSLSCNEPKPVPKSVATARIPQEAEFAENISDNSSDSDNQGDGPADLRELEVFIVTSRAFETLRLNLRLFIFPEESSTPTSQRDIKSIIEDNPISELPTTADEAREKVESCTLGLKTGNPIPKEMNGYNVMSKSRSTTATKTTLGSRFNIFVR